MKRVALIGANGHGMHHREHVASLPDVSLVGLCDVLPVDDPPPGVQLFTDADQMLKAVEPDIVIVSTPPATHLPFATAALRAGADVLLEKPPVLDLGEHNALETVLAETGGVVQVGFQALASPALSLLRRQPGDISIVGAWLREDDYWNRSPWAGRLPLDGALRNPFAHAVMQALAVASAPPVHLEVTWCRVRDIEVDDTSTLRLLLADGRRVLIAVTLAAHPDEFIDGEMRVGAVSLNFREFLGESLLQNLIVHRDAGTPLLAPLGLTRSFTAVAETLSRMPRPGKVDFPERTIPGISSVLRRCAGEFALLSEIDLPWAATVTSGAANIV